jgi:hypothetical protein
MHDAYVCVCEREREREVCVRTSCDVPFQEQDPTTHFSSQSLVNFVHAARHTEEAEWWLGYGLINPGFDPRVQSWASPRGIHDGWNDSGTGFSLSAFSLSCRQCPPLHHTLWFISPMLCSLNRQLTTMLAIGIFLKQNTQKQPSVYILKLTNSGTHFAGCCTVFIH